MRGLREDLPAVVIGLAELDARLSGALDATVTGLRDDIRAREDLATHLWDEIASLNVKLGADIDAREGLDAALRSVVARLDERLAAETAAREALDVSVGQGLRALEERLAALEERVSAVELTARAAARQATLSRVERAVERLEAASAGSNSPGAPRVDAVVPGSVGAPGGSRLYLAIEDELRGDPEVIRRRQDDYAQRIVAKLGREGRLADLGCGRGEFLAAAVAVGLRPLGVDTNEDAVAEVAAAGYEVVLDDALGFLQQAPDGSLDAVTLFHVIEHVGFESFVALVREASRALRPGGVIAMETPNVSNVSVGSHTFWLDPTHVRPIPPLLLELVVRHSGFRDLEMLPLHPYPEDDLVTDDFREREPLIAGLTKAVFGAQDIGIIAVRDDG